MARWCNASSSSRLIASPRLRRSSSASLSICASRAAGSLKLTPTDSDWRPRRRCPLGVFLLIWEGQPPHGCRSLAELNAASPYGADQENPAASLGFASRRQEPRLPSRIRWIVLALGGAACAGARYDLRGHGSGEWHGRRGGLGKTGAGELGSGRARQEEGGAVGILRTGHSGDGQVIGTTKSF